MRVAAILGLASLIGVSSPAWALDKVTFGTNWLADPEAGGYYQAVVDGTYAKYGLDVTIIPGGPQSNGALMLLYRKFDFFMGGDQIGNCISAEAKLPLIAVAADFHAFYRDCQVVGAEGEGVEASRLALCLLTKRTIAGALGLLGISAPEQM